VVVVVDFDGDGNGDVAARTLTLRLRTFGQLDMRLRTEARHARGVGGCVAMMAVQSSTLVGHVAVAVAVKVHDHDDDHD
jgi:hypothetical protein